MNRKSSVVSTILLIATPLRQQAKKMEDNGRKKTSFAKKYKMALFLLDEMTVLRFYCRDAFDTMVVG